MPTLIRPPVSLSSSEAVLRECAAIIAQGNETNYRREGDPVCLGCMPSWTARQSGWIWSDQSGRWQFGTQSSFPDFSPFLQRPEQEIALPRVPDFNASSIFDDVASPRNGRCDDPRCARLDTVTPCTVCWLSYCADSMRYHNHNGPMCQDCGFNVSDGVFMRHCWECDRAYCPEHVDYHYHEPEPEDDYDHFDRRQPRVTGSQYGEASLDWIDNGFLQGDIVHGTRSAALELELEYNPPEGTVLQTSVSLDPSVGVGTDGSLTNGIEVTTPPSNGVDLELIVRDTANKLRTAGYVAMETCGMHTHIDLRDKVDDKKFMSHLFNALFAVEDILYAMQTERRYANTYSVPLRNTYKFFDMYGQMSGDFDYKFYKQSKTLEGKRYLDMEKSRKYAGVRYAAFNFHSVYFRGSLECRLHEGNNDGDEALRWIDLLESIIARVEQGHSYKVMKELAEMKVTRTKVRKFARYFRLRPEQVEYVNRRIGSGQGFGFRLPVSINWGVPVKGRPKGEPKPQGRHRRLYVGRRVRCNRCYREFTLRAYHDYCLGCSYPLFDRYEGRQYTRVSTQSNRAASAQVAMAGGSLTGSSYEVNLSNFIWEDAASDSQNF